MKRKFSSLIEITNNHEITKKENPGFCLNLEHALLLSLREQGLLTEIQYRLAKEQLYTDFKNTKR